MKLSIAIIRGLAIAAVAITLAHLSSCAPRAIPATQPTRQAEVARQQSASPAIDDARRVTGQADQQGAVTAAQLAQAQQTATAAQRKAREALAEADRLVKQKTATEVELSRQKSLVEALCDSMDKMEVDLSETSKSLVKEKDLRVEASAMLVHAQDLVRQKDAEADTLRLNFNQAVEQRDAYYHVADNNAKAAMTAQGKIQAADARTGVWQKIALVGCGIAAILAVIFIVLPLVRRAAVGM